MSEWSRVCREAFPDIIDRDWIAFDPQAPDQGYVVDLETAPDHLILADADWFEHEGEVFHARRLRAFVEWRRRRKLKLVPLHA